MTQQSARSSFSRIRILPLIAILYVLNIRALLQFSVFHLNAAEMAFGLGLVGLV